jgi:hypothetical protein
VNRYATMVDPPAEAVGGSSLTCWLFGAGLTQPLTDTPLTGTQGRGPDAMRRFAGVRFRLTKLCHRADQRVCEVPAV